ncbi:MAG: hypothetical protein ACR5LF_14895 [Symbiopectobacterium sp.]
MNTLTKHNAPIIAGVEIIIAGVEITTDAKGRFNLNALHKASGGDNGIGIRRGTMLLKFGGAMCTPALRYG